MTGKEFAAQWRPEYRQEMFEGEFDAFERMIAVFNREIGL
jgi:hypothetical protein